MTAGNQAHNRQDGMNGLPRSATPSSAEGHHSSLSKRASRLQANARLVIIREILFLWFQGQRKGRLRQQETKG